MSEEKKQIEIAQIVQNLLKDLNEKGEDCLRHAICGIELEDNGKPGAIVLKFEGDPIALLGMIDVLKAKLDDVKAEIIEGFSESSESVRGTKKKGSPVERAIKNVMSEINMEMPADLRKSLEKYDSQIQDAIANKDFKALSDLKNKVLQDVIQNHLDDNTNIPDAIKKKIEEIKNDPASDEDIDIKNIM